MSENENDREVRAEEDAEPIILRGPWADDLAAELAARASNVEAVYVRRRGRWVRLTLPTAAPPLKGA